MTARHRAVAWWPTFDELAATRRLVRLSPVVLAAAVVAVFVARTGIEDEMADVALAAAVAIAAAGALGDRAADTLAATPRTRAQRGIARLFVVGPVVTASWLAAAGAARWLDPPTADPVASTSWVPGSGSWLLLATIALGAIAVDVTADRSGAVHGTVGATAVLVTVAVSLHLPPTVNPYPAAVHLWWWAGFALVATGFLALALADPGRSRFAVTTTEPQARRINPIPPRPRGRPAVRGSRRS